MEKENVELFRKGKLRYIQDKHKEALDSFSKMDLKGMGNFDESTVHHYKALCYAKLMKFEKSIEEFQLAEKFHPNNAKIHFDKGMTHYFFYSKNWISQFFIKAFNRENKLEGAIECFQGGILVDSKNADCWYYRGYMLELLGREKEAKESFLKSIECDKKIKNSEGSGLFTKLRK